MSELNPKLSRRGLDLAQTAAALALTAPDQFAKRTILEAVDKLRKHYGFDDRQKRHLLRKSIEIGCTTYTELAVETRLPKPEVIRLIKEMQDHGEVETQTLMRGDRGGRPVLYISLTGRTTRKIPEK